MSPAAAGCMLLLFGVEPTDRALTGWSPFKYADAYRGYPVSEESHVRWISEQLSLTAAEAEAYMRDGWPE